MENNKLKNQGFKKISTLLMDIWQNPGATETYIIEITKAINSTERDIIQNLQKVIIGTIHNILINLQTNRYAKMFISKEIYIYISIVLAKAKTLNT